MAKKKYNDRVPYKLLEAMDPENSMTHAEIAKILHISPCTVSTWMQRYPEFEYAVHVVQRTSDAAMECSLWQRSRGYSHPDVHICQFQGQVIKTVITKHYPPDGQAAFNWLKNRQPEAWRDRSEVLQKTEYDENQLEAIRQRNLDRCRQRTLVSRN